jgi:N-methylhydantoinase B
MTLTGATVDPITFEILSHRLYQITREMGSTLERVGGTVNTTQMKDYISALYRPNGDVLCTGETIAWHVACAGAAVRHIIERFGRDEGIQPDDMFLFNDPYIGAIHQSDVYIISPIHYENRVVAWSATFVHVMDIGALSPGGNSPAATEICHEGVRIPGIKLIDRGVLRTDVFDAITNMTRQPMMVGLDLKCEIAANNVAKARMQELCAQYGADLVDAAAEDMTRYTRAVLRKRLAEIPDGSWSAEGLIQASDAWHVQVTLRKESDHLYFDFSGSAPQAEVGINLPYHATVGACFEGLLYTLGYDLPKNQGFFEIMDVVAPERTVFNPRYPAPVSLNTTSGGAAAKYLANSVLSQMMATSEKWSSEVIAPILGFRFARHAGVNQYGGYYVSTLIGLTGVGARSQADGIDSGGIDCGRPSTSHNVEWVESNFPLLYLFRRHILDGAGAGKLRGGAGEETALVLHDAPEGNVKVVALGVAGLRNSGHGLAGGYPGAPSLLVHLEDTAVRRLLAESGPLDNLDELGGRSTLLPYCTIGLTANDVLFMRFASGGGYGDPLERDPGRVVNDVANGLVSVDAAEMVYGVVIRAGGGLYMAATDRRRESLRRERLNGVERRNRESDTARDDASRDPLVGASVIARMTHPLQEHLAVYTDSLGAWIRCTQCGHVLCEASRDWARTCRVRRLPPTEAGPHMADLVGQFLLEQLYCPSCGVLLKTDVVSQTQEEHPTHVSALEAADGGKRDSY